MFSCIDVMKEDRAFWLYQVQWSSMKAAQVKHTTCEQ